MEDSANEHIYHNEVWGEGGGMCYRYDIHSQGPHACTLVHSTLPETCQWQCEVCIVINVCVCGGSVRGRSVHSRDDGVSSAGVSPPHVIRGGGLGLRARSLHKRIMINTCIAICNGFTDIILIVGSSHSN